MRTGRHQPAEDELGPAGFLAVEFPGGRISGPGFELLLSLARPGAIRVLDDERATRPAVTARRPEERRRLDRRRVRGAKARILTPAWKDLAALLDDDADRLRAIEQGLAGRPDPQTLGLLLVDKALILANNGNRDEAISILGTLAVSPDSTLAAEHHAKATLAILIFN